jgi:hypothetical protein
MPGPALILRRASISRKGGSWQHEDHDVFDGGREVGRLFLDANNVWFWGVDFQITGRKSYGHGRRSRRQRRRSGPNMLPGEVALADLCSRPEICQCCKCGLPHSLPWYPESPALVVSLGGAFLCPLPRRRPTPNR